MLHDDLLEVFHAISGTFISMVSVFKAKSTNHEKSNTELESFDLHDDQSQCLMILSERKARCTESNSSQLFCWIY